jgi:tripartite-type tricarboxylate transporter receptor subunit TctC
MMRRYGWLAAGVFFLAILFPTGAPAAGFPERDITLVVPWAAGGGTDTLARTLVKNGKKYFAVNMNVVNRVGGTGVVGMDSVAKAKPDGYTVGLSPLTSAPTGSSASPTCPTGTSALSLC